MAGAFLVPKPFIATKQRQITVQLGMAPNDDDPRSGTRDEATTWLAQEAADNGQEEISVYTTPKPPNGNFRPPVPKNKAQEAAKNFYPPKTGGEINGDASTSNGNPPPFPSPTNAAKNANPGTFPSQNQAGLPYNFQPSSSEGFESLAKAAKPTSVDRPTLPRNNDVNNDIPYNFQPNSGDGFENLAKAATAASVEPPTNPGTATKSTSPYNFNPNSGAVFENLAKAATTSSMEPPIFPDSNANNPQPYNFQPNSGTGFDNLAKAATTSPSRSNQAANGASANGNPPTFPVSTEQRGNPSSNAAMGQAGINGQDTSPKVNGSKMKEATPNTMPPNVNGATSANGNPSPFEGKIAANNKSNESKSANGNPPPFNTEESAATKTRGGLKGVRKENGQIIDSGRIPYQYTVKKSARSKSAPKTMATGNPPPFPASSGSMMAAGSSALGSDQQDDATTNNFFFGSPAKQDSGATGLSRPTEVGEVANTMPSNTASFKANGSSRPASGGNDNDMNSSQKPIEQPFFVEGNRAPNAAANQESQAVESKEEGQFSQVQPLTPPEWAKPFETFNNPLTMSANSNDEQSQYEEAMGGNMLEQESEQPEQGWDGPFAEQFAEQKRQFAEQFEDQKRQFDRMANKAAVAAVTYSIPVTAGTVFGISQGPGIADEVSKAYESLAAIPWTKPAAVSSQNSLKSYMERLDQPWTDPRYASSRIQGQASSVMNPSGDDNAAYADGQSTLNNNGEAISDQASAMAAGTQETVEPTAGTGASEGQQGPTLSLYTEYLQNPNYGLEPKPEPQPAPSPSYADDTWNRFFRSSEPKTTPPGDNSAKQTVQSPSYADYMWERVYGRKLQEEPPVQNQALPSNPSELKTPSAADSMWERAFSQQQGQQMSEAEVPTLPPVERGPSVADTIWQRMQAGPQQPMSEAAEAQTLPHAQSGASAADTMWQRMQTGQRQDPTQAWPETQSEWTQTQPQQQAPVDSVQSGAQAWPEKQSEWTQTQPEQQAPVDSVQSGTWVAQPDYQAPSESEWVAQPDYQAPSESDTWAQTSEEYQGQPGIVGPDGSTWAQSQGEQTAAPPEYQATQPEPKVPAAAAEAEMLAPVSWAASQGYFIPTNTSLF